MIRQKCSVLILAQIFKCLAKLEIRDSLLSMPDRGLFSQGAVQTCPLILSAAVSSAQGIRINESPVEERTISPCMANFNRL